MKEAVVDYSNKLIMAPMVRIGTLPTRLLALDYGADLVYSEELIDYRMLRCKRIENAILDTVDFVDEDQNVVFRTCKKERERIILQIGTCDPERCLRVAKMVEKDVAGIDINMGCPKEFSLKGGMGAALLTQPEKIKQILTTLVKELSCPITCKIRVLDTVEDTVKLAKLIESTGVSALAVHGRTKEERPQHRNRNHFVRAVVRSVDVPVIANGGSGEITCYEDVERFRAETGATSVMLARQVEKNCSIFRKDGLLPLDVVIRSYLKFAIDYNNNTTNTKYCIQQMLGSLQDTPCGRALLNAQLMKDICDLWNMGDYYVKKQEDFKTISMNLKRLHADCNFGLHLKRRKLENNEIWETDAKFIKSVFGKADLPKTVLCNWTRRNNIKQPNYQTFQIEKSFKSIVTVNNKMYSSSCLEKNKRMAEQGAALVALIGLEIINNEQIKLLLNS
ncbi:tRNA-dihydrouridine(20) synthase [NAD(P)+]-like [Centruroides vittatus]|uniref:tRNA-dihydrouridine(20) synthase [NAD(P)+]-like n=1 Tax=Centruroides vittatus TaxID=120091 RepID=UPI00350FFC51